MRIISLLLLVSLSLSSAIPSRWSSWSSCSKSCGGGVQTRQKICITQSNDDIRRVAEVVRGGSGGGRELDSTLRAVERRKRSPREPIDRLERDEPRRVNDDCAGITGRRACNPNACPNGNIKNPRASKGGISFYGFSPRIVIKDTPSYKAFKGCLGSSKVRPAVAIKNNRAAVAASNTAKTCKASAVAAKAASARSKRATSCANLPNFLSKVTSGLDASVLDLLAPAGSPSTNGVENNLFRFTCDFGRKLLIGTAEYDLPDQISNVYSESVHDLNLSEEIIRSSSDVKEMKSRELSGGGAFGKLSFSGSYSYKQMRNVFKAEERQYYDYKYTLASLLVHLNNLPIDDSDFPSDATNHIDSRLRGFTYAQKPRDYQNFVQIYGTHASHRSRFGGVMHGTVSVEKSYTESKTETEVKRQAKVAFGKLLSVQGVSVNTGVTEDRSFKSNSEIKISCFGGSVTVGCTNVAITSWLPSVEQNPHLLSAEGLPISDYVNDGQVRSGLDTAICRHLALVYLTDLVDRVNNINGLQAFATSLRNKYTGLRTEAQSHLTILRAEASASQHDASCKTVRDVFTAKAEALLDDVSEGGRKTRALTRTGYDQPMNSVCPADYSLSRIVSTFSSGHRDRQWDLHCASAAFGLVEGSSCSFTPNYVNAHHQPFTYECPSNGAITGMSSVHDGNSRIEDRRFKFKCCRLSSFSCSALCTWTSTWTANEGAMDFSVPAGRYLAGVKTEAKVKKLRRGGFFRLGRRKYSTDRIWKFQTCQVQSC